MDIVLLVIFIASDLLVIKIYRGKSRIFYISNLIFSIGITALYFWYLSVFMVVWSIWLIGFIILGTALVFRYHKKLYDLKVEKSWLTGSPTDDDVYWKNGWYNNPEDEDLLIEDRLCSTNFSLNMAKTSAKVLTGILVTGTVLLLVWICVLLFKMDFTRIDMRVNQKQVTITAGAYDYSFSPEEIQEIKVVNRLPKDNLRRVNGAATDDKLLGKFRENTPGALKPDYDKKQALCNHRELLLLKREHLDELLCLVDETIKGETMSKLRTTNEDIERAKQKYAREARERYGDTEAYQESEKRYAAYSDDDKARMGAEMNEIFEGFASMVNQDPGKDEAQRLVKEWQDHISRYSYPCTKEILAGLGEMYVADERFTKNLDKYGEGTARFMSDAIRIYCSGPHKEK